jgi:hypothetical protein
VFLLQALGACASTLGAGTTDSSVTDARDADLATPEVPLTLAPVRLIAPMSTGTVTSRRPRLRWALPAGVDGARVQVCRDRACTMPILTQEVKGASHVPMMMLPSGIVFWRAFPRAGSTVGSMPSATWEMVVGTISAPVDTSNGTLLDVDGEGHADVVVGAAIADHGTGRAYVYPGGAG